MSGQPGPTNSTNSRQVAADIALVIVTHNSASVLLAPIQSLSQSSDIFTEIVFVDNASTDSTEKLISTKLPTAKLIGNTQNRGFASAVNQGVQATSAPLILLANPDVEWSSEDVVSLAEFLNFKPRTAAVSAALRFPDNSPQKSVRRFPTHANIWLSRQSPLRVFQEILPTRFSYTLADPATSSRIDAVAATFMLIRRSAFNSINGMDEEYFLYVEDTDLCKRWHDAGFEVWMDTDVSVIHDWQGGSGKNPVLKKYHRNGIRRYFQKHHADKPLRNALLFGLLDMMNTWDLLRHGHRGLHVD